MTADDWDAVEAGFDRHFAADLYVPEARSALARLREREAQLKQYADENYNALMDEREKAIAAEARANEYAVHANLAEARVAELEEALRAGLDPERWDEFLAVARRALAHEEEQTNARQSTEEGGQDLHGAGPASVPPSVAHEEEK